MDLEISIKTVQLINSGKSDRVSWVQRKTHRSKIFKSNFQIVIRNQ